MKKLEIKELTIVKSSDDTTLLVNNLNIDIEAGKITALLGSSGSGKSLTCSGIMDVIPNGVTKKSGSVLYNGKSVDMSKERGKLISIIMQNPSNAFNPLYTMKSHVKEVLKVRGLKYSDELAIPSLLEAGLLEPYRVLDLYPFQMSGGMLQRVMIALALLSDSDFLLADEPTTDLDLIVQSEILATLKDIIKKRSLGVLLVTHDLGVIAKTADSIAVIDRGAIVERRDVNSFFKTPKHSVSKALIEAHLSLYKEEEVANSTICQ